MSTSLYNEEHADFRHRGDYVQVDGELKAVGGATMSGTITGTTATLVGATFTGTITGTGATYTGGTVSGVTMTGTITGTGATYTGGTISGVTLTGTVTGTGATYAGGTVSGVTLTGTITSSGASLTTLKLSSGPTGTTAGAAWTSGVPALTDGQLYITVTAGSTTYRIPVWANA